MTTVHVEQAQIRTARVEIRALTIDKRQVTLALFRQLPEREVIDFDTGTLRGPVWGHVNYCPRDCDAVREFGRHAPHLHIIWQDGNELVRDAPAWQEFHDHPGWAELIDAPQLFIAT